MYAIVYKSDGFPICRQVPGVTPDPVVTWNTEDAARDFISSKGADGECQPLQLTDDAMDSGPPLPAKLVKPPKLLKKPKPAKGRPGAVQHTPQPPNKKPGPAAPGR